MRLIDADALRYEIVKYFDGLPIQGHYDMLKMVDEAPTIEAEPVKHGRWIKISDRNYKCSACGDWWSGEGKEIKTLLYCPNCGAKMEDKTRNNKRDTFSK